MNILYHREIQLSTKNKKFNLLRIIFVKINKIIASILLAIAIIF